MAYYQLSQAYRAAGRLEDAEEAGNMARALGMSLEFSVARTRLYQGDPQPMLEFLDDQPSDDLQTLAERAKALYSAGRSAEAEAALARLLDEPVQGTDAIEIAQVYAWQRKADEAFRWLQLALDGEHLHLLLRLDDAEFGPIRDDPRWDDVLRRLGRHPDQLANLEFDIEVPD